MKIFLAYIGDILHCPPAISLAHALDDLGIEVHVCIPKLSSIRYEDHFKVSNRVRFFEVSDKYIIDRNIIQKEEDLLKIRKVFWNYFDENKNGSTIIWCLSSGTVKYLGKRLIKEKYILHLLELTEELYYIESRHWIKLSREYAKNALAVIECEYNRAHITKAWWGLDNLPYVLPNKPYPDTEGKKNAQITSSGEAKDLIDKLSGRKIILYQGNMSKERPLDIFIKAVHHLGNGYAFLALTNSENPYPGIEACNYFHLPFIAPPYHLEITSHAYIGVLSYVPIKNDYSILNTLYCAPNKTWEYAKFGVPMIGNDLPALKMMFCQYGNGICVQDMSVNEVCKAIEQMNEQYDQFRVNSERYYKSVDYCQTVKKIIGNSTKEVF